MAAPRTAGNFIELLPIAFLPGAHSNEGFKAAFPFKVVFVGHGKTPLMSTAGWKHWMLIFLKRFTLVTTCHYQKTPGPSGTWKSRGHARIRYFTTRCVTDFRYAMFQTRHREKSCHFVTCRRQSSSRGVGI